MPVLPPSLAPTRRRSRNATPTRWLLATAVALSPLSAAVGQAPAREQTADQQVLHVLHRLAFGPRPGDVARVRTIGVDAWIEQQLHPEQLDDRETDRWLSQFEVLSMRGEEIIARYPPPGVQLARLTAQQAVARRDATGDAPRLSPEDSAALARSVREGGRLTSQLLTARLGRAVASERQLLEVMTDFWANHFSVFSGKPLVRYYLPEYEATLRQHALGNFRTLLGAVATSPAMLLYLDQVQSVADSGRRTLQPARVAQLRPAQRAAMRRRLTPEQQQRLDNLQARRPRGINENYARELMELHTLGVDGGYTQQDVMDVARALTGWSLSRGPQQGGTFQFRPEVHDAEAKTILGEHFPAGHGQDEGERVLDLLAAHPATARFIATKLVRRFVSDEPPADLVDRAAETFTRTKGDIREVLRTIIASDAFFADAAFRSKVKTPFELVVSAARALDGRPDPTPRSVQLVAQLGQPIYGRQTPDGWPDEASEWINTGAILNRMNFGLTVGANRLPGARLGQWSVAQELATRPVEQQVDGLVRALFGGIVSPETRGVLVSGDNPLLARAEMSSSASADMRPDLSGFPKLVGLAIGAPEFQRR